MALALARENLDMGRLLGFILGGAALAIYGPYLFLQGDALADYQKVFTDVIGDDLFARVITYGPGILAGLALLLLAVRGRD